MKVSTQLVIALNNGTDQVVNAGDYREDHDAAPAQGCKPHGRNGWQIIVDGMTVVVGGVDTSPDFGLEGIVVNVEENKQADGGKMCLVMLNEDSSKMLMVPIANLLTGEEATAAIKRRAYLRDFNLKISPEHTDLMEALRNYPKAGHSAKRIVAELRISHPRWEVSEKRVKKCMKELDPGPKPSSSSYGDAAKSGPPESNIPVSVI